MMNDDELLLTFVREMSTPVSMHHIHFRLFCDWHMLRALAMKPKPFPRRWRNLEKKSWRTRERGFEVVAKQGEYRSVTESNQSIPVIHCPETAYCILFFSTVFCLQFPSSSAEVSQLFGCRLRDDPKTCGMCRCFSYLFIKSVQTVPSSDTQVHSGEDDGVQHCSTKHVPPPWSPCFDPQ